MMRSFPVADEDSANGWSRPTTAGRRRLYRPLSSPVLGVRRQGGRPDSNRHRRDHDPGCSRYTTATTSANDRIRTGDPPVDSRALFAAELRSRDSAGGIRTHGLELMRLARTASPLPRSLPGWIRTSGLRFPKPAGCPASLQADRDTPGGTRTRSFPVESRASSAFDHRGKQRTGGGAGIDPAPTRYQRVVPPRDTDLRSSGGRTRTRPSRLTVARRARSTTPDRKKKEGEG